jgi:hypothetical protein
METCVEASVDLLNNWVAVSGWGCDWLGELGVWRRGGHRRTESAGGSREGARLTVDSTDLGQLL